MEQIILITVKELRELIDECFRESLEARLPKPDERRYLTTQEALAYAKEQHCEISRTALWKLARTNRIEMVRFKTRNLYLRSSLQAWMDEQIVHGKRERVFQNKA